MNEHETVHNELILQSQPEAVSLQHHRCYNNDAETRRWLNYI